MRGISEDRLRKIANETHDSDDTNMPVLSLLDMLMAECQELNPWLSIDENTPKDRELLLYYPNMFRSNKKIIGYAFERNVSPMHGHPTHYQELPDDPEPGDKNGQVY